jgi:hypothetical protein
MEDLLGFAGTEAVAGATNLPTGTLRHDYCWYSPVGVEYPGFSRRVARRYDPTDDGDADIHGSSATHKTVTLTFDALLEAHVEPDVAATEGAVDDGAGGTLDCTGSSFYDFWVDAASARFRWYPDATDGTPDTPGTEGTDYYTCVRTDEDSEPEQVDPDGYTYFRVRLPVQVVGA